MTTIDERATVPDRRTTAEAMLLTGLSERSIREYVRRGVFKAHRVGRKVLIETSSIEAFLRGTPITPTAATTSV